LPDAALQETMMLTADEGKDENALTMKKR